MKRVPVLVAAMLLASACSTVVQTTGAGEVGVDRQQRMIVSAQEVDAITSNQYSEVLDGARQKNLLDTDPFQVARVKGVAQRLIAQAPTFRPDAAGWAWETHVIESKELNAWCMPGGKIAVYSALLEKLQLTDAELAAVMGHEMAHALREHAREKISKSYGANVLFGVTSAIIGVDISGIGGQGFDLLVGLPNSRAMETEADRIGVELMARAGYDPRAAANVWMKMNKASQGDFAPQFLSTHPSNRSRIEDMTVYAERVRPLYERASGAKS
ncbi:M48 family metallopeptidase [soil metagenome]